MAADPRNRWQRLSPGLTLAVLLAGCAYAFTENAARAAAIGWPIDGLPSMLLLATALAALAILISAKRPSRATSLAAAAAATQFLLLGALLAMTGFAALQASAPAWHRVVLPLVALLGSAQLYWCVGQWSANDRAVPGGNSRFVPPALCAAALGAAVLLGHHALGDVLSGEGTWRFVLASAALLAAGVALMSAIMSRAVIASIAIVVAVLAAVFALLGFGGGAPIAGARVTATTLAQTPHPGIVAAIAGTALLVALGAIAHFAARRRRAWLAATWFAGVFAAMIAVTELAGIRIGAHALHDPAAAWPAAVAGFAVLAMGLSMMTMGLGERQDLSRRGLWRAFGIAFASALLSIWLWVGLDGQRSAVMQRGLSAADTALSGALTRYSNARLSSFARLAERLQLLRPEDAATIFAADATALLAAVPGARVVSWRDASGAVLTPVVAIDAASAAEADVVHHRAAELATRMARRYAVQPRETSSGGRELPPS